MLRSLLAFVVLIPLVATALPDRLASAATARAPHGAVHGRKAGKKPKATRPPKGKAAKGKPDKAKNDPGFAL